MAGGLRRTTAERSSADAGSASHFNELVTTAHLATTLGEALGKQRARFRGSCFLMNEMLV